MQLQEIFDAYNNYIMPTYVKVPLVFVKGKGSRLWDIHNKVYLDFFPGWGVGNLGHCHPKVMQAVRDQVSKLIFIPNNYYHIPQARLAKEIAYWTYPAKVFFCNSGAEANEAAIKFSRKFGQGRYEIITFENSFHGRTLAALSATGQKKYQSGFEPLVAGFRTVKFNDLEAVKQAITAETVAIMLELIQGEGGINVAAKDFVLALRNICDEKNLLLIIDEVQTGIGRTGKLFCYQNFGIIPDIMTLAKALGGGLPIGCMVVKKDIADILTPGMHASTFGGGPVVAKAALAVLRAVHKEKLLANAREMGEYLLFLLNALQDRYEVIKEVRGIGLMLGVELNIEGKGIVEKCLERGLLINCTHDKVLRLMPALNITKKEIDKAIRILNEALR
ncbi:MAG: aspartate aminotransferase family protein [Candidatus Omnitrophica bacterium CG08_land_8_20_14_0_20_41_16]|uniref:Acetylornithine aminotransferase n=1 Tax=Candidatus Sherwoodlollariibacterium unditelluris TaxID=1974757 RepID=A0A2G9YJ90_9BACT|nr:MAG: aspartate aminotransferase family protein [Candidatus Omnitrophica bacterium CG23_combo_of_CG06-09_8_20_14_all_41_10]PIS33391.1 MAG: aspartate aminotransferase family protein [Candidatus Omnitrophica bacterium CG08_land_8_20_14_0_20_41_16]